MSSSSAVSHDLFPPVPSVEECGIPRQEIVNAVHSFTPTGDWIGFSVPVEKAAEMFEVVFSVYTHRDSGITSIRTLLTKHIELVHPTISEATASTAAAPALCASPTPIGPLCLQELYGTPKSLPTVWSNHLGDVAYHNNAANFSDLHVQFSLPHAGVVRLRHLDNQNFDIQYTVGLASGVPVDFIAVGNSPGFTNFLDTAIFLLNKTPIPRVVMTNYAGAEKDNSLQLLRNLCNMYAQIDARETSLLFSSDDGGVGLPNCATFVPTFPNDCPFVTSVGATTNPPFSSGGFSNYSPPAPANFTFPGTSVASIVELLNDEIIAAGKPSLGFLNPLLYLTAAPAFTDVTTGGNPGCGTNGFPAKTGWGLVTGLGTPNFAKVRAAAGLRD
ncbi:peptidase S8/S53 domain-containing protein [Trametes maxima]|nr:peptidase S8/S53 domain-containing protein [Trametes maxima]